MLKNKRVKSESESKRVIREKLRPAWYRTDECGYAGGLVFLNTGWKSLLSTSLGRGTAKVLGFKSLCSRNTAQK